MTKEMFQIYKHMVYNNGDCPDEVNGKDSCSVCVHNDERGDCSLPSMCKDWDILTVTERLKWCVKYSKIKLIKEILK